MKFSVSARSHSVSLQLDAHRFSGTSSMAGICELGTGGYGSLEEGNPLFNQSRAIANDLPKADPNRTNRSGRYRTHAVPQSN